MPISIELIKINYNLHYLNIDIAYSTDFYSLSNKNEHLCIIFFIFISIKSLIFSFYDLNEKIFICTGVVNN